MTVHGEDVDGGAGFFPDSFSDMRYERSSKETLRSTIGQSILGGPVAAAPWTFDEPDLQSSERVLGGP